MLSPNTEVRRKRKKQTVGRVTRVVHHSWTYQENAVLVRCLHVMVDDPKWKGDNDNECINKTRNFEEHLWKSSKRLTLTETHSLSFRHSRAKLFIILSEIL